MPKPENDAPVHGSHYLSILDRIRANGTGPLYGHEWPTFDEFVNLRHNGYNPWRYNFFSVSPL